jgi:hypothetical protein
MTIDLNALFTPGRPTVAGQTLLLGYGKANYRNTLATYSAMKVSPPFARVTAITSGKRHGQMAVSQAGRHEMNGVLIAGNIEHPYGTVILLQASWKRSGAPIRDASLFFRLRLGAPLYSVSAYVPTEQDNTYGDRFPMFAGYADLLTADELAALGIEVNASYVRKFMELDEVEECFMLQEMQPETIGRPQLTAIATPTGIEMKELPPEPARRLVLRRR